MNLLAKNPELFTLIHDTNNSISLLGWYINKIKDRLADLDIQDRSIENAIEMLLKQPVLIQQQVDAYYTKLKAKNT